MQNSAIKMIMEAPEFRKKKTFNFLFTKHIYIFYAVIGH